MIHLNELPVCLLVEIFSYLPIGEVLRLKLVCKAWRELSTLVRFKSLSFYRYDYEEELISFIRPPPFPENYDLHLNDFELFFQSAGRMVSGVRRLRIGLFSHPVNYANNRLENFVNRFQLLEELVLNVFDADDDEHIEEPYPVFSLKLRRLRKLQLQFAYRVLDLDCPELNYLDLKGPMLENGHIRYPEKLRTLIDLETIDVVNNVNLFRKFVNLKNLVFDLKSKVNQINSFNRTFFEALPQSLQRLIFINLAGFRWIDSEWMDLEDYLRRTYEIEQDSPGLRIFCLGIELSLSRFTAEEREPLPLDTHVERSQFPIANLANSVDANICLQELINFAWIEEQLPTFDLLYQKIYSDHPYLHMTLYGHVANKPQLFQFIERVKPMDLKIRCVFPRSFFERLAKVGAPFILSLNFDAANLRFGPSALNFLLSMTRLNSATIFNCPLTLTESLDLIIAVVEKRKSPFTFTITWGSSVWFHFSTKPFAGHNMDLRYNDADGAEQTVSRSFDLERYEWIDELDVLRYVNVKLKSRPRTQWIEGRNARQFRDLLEFFFLTDELNQQAALDLFAFKMIEHYARAIPIYLGDL